MKNILFIALLVLMCLGMSCTYKSVKVSTKTTSDSTEAKVETDEFEVASCSLDYLNNILKNIDDLREADITLYLESLNYDCETVPEYNVLNNKVLLKILSKYPDEVVDIIDEQRQSLNVEKILNEIKNPLDENISIKKLLKKIKETDYESKARKEIINALKEAKENKSDNE